MKRLAALTAGALIGLLFTAAPANAGPSDCNWSTGGCPTHVDASEDRTSTPDLNVGLGTDWRIGYSSEDPCRVSITNFGSFTHGMRIQVYKIATGSVIWDSGHLDVIGFGTASFNTHLSPEPFSADTAVKGWNDLGNVTYNRYWMDADSPPNPNTGWDKVSVYSYGSFPSGTC
jgi:hypothetical protein